MKRKSYRYLFLMLSSVSLFISSLQNWPMLGFLGVCLLLAGLNTCVWLWSRTAVPKKRQEDRIRFA